MARYRTVQTQKSPHLRGFMDSVGSLGCRFGAGPLSNYYRNILIGKHSVCARFGSYPQSYPRWGSAAPSYGRLSTGRSAVSAKPSSRGAGSESGGGEGYSLAVVDQPSRWHT
jgi:hypothetical protein